MNIIILSLFAGAIGTGLGGFLTTLFGSRTEKMVSIFLSFAGGVMISIVFLELIPESAEYVSMGITAAGLVLGAILVFFLNKIMDKISGPAKIRQKLHDSYAEFFHASEMIGNKKNMLRSGMMLLFAIALHNIPEGLALGASGYHDVSLGLTLAIIIGLHNVPEGIAVAAPLIAGGLSKTKAVLITLLAGATTVIGAFIGVMLGGISDFALALSFSVAGGAMLYVVLGEILPQSIITNKDRVPTIFALAGIIVGMLFTRI